MRCASHANAAASTCVGRQAVLGRSARTVAAGSAAARRRIRCRCSAPPPHTSSVAARRGVPSNGVATLRRGQLGTASPARPAASAWRPCRASCAASQSALNRSRPVLFGGGSAKYGSRSICCEQRRRSPVRPRPTRRRRRSAGRDVARTRGPSARWPARSRSRWSTPSAPSTVRLRDAAEVEHGQPSRRGSANTARWNAGTSGAPWPPAATSRLRKSATTSMPHSSASSAALSNCSV